MGSTHCLAGSGLSPIMHQCCWHDCSSLISPNSYSCWVFQLRSSPFQTEHSSLRFNITGLSLITNDTFNRDSQ